MTAPAPAGPAAPARGPHRRRWRPVGLGVRLFAAEALVVLAGAITLLVVALLVAPPVFHDHLRKALGTVSPTTLEHADRAFAEAVLLSLAIAVAVAVVAALAVTWLVTRRIVAPVADLAAAARRLAAGRYDSRVADPGLGPEFATLADSFNSMAARLAGIEHTRRRLLADLAHELRTPIASIEATVEAVADGVLPADDTSWTTLTEQAGRLDRLVADLAAVSDAEERALTAGLHPQPLGDLADSAVAAASARYAAKGVQLRLTVEPATPRVRADANRLAEALANLLDNALRHTHRGGSVIVTTGALHQFGRQLARISIADTGDGFPPAEADRLFERFYRTDSARSRAAGGSGIGLTITKAIVNAHDGTVTAHSDGPGRGATFTVTLPAWTQAARTAQQAHQAPQRDRRR